jgi:hypothetical protein
MPIVLSAPNPSGFWVMLILIAGLISGLVFLARGFGGYSAAARISGLAPSRIESIAAGEVLVTGTAEPIELTLISPLQSAPCLYYRSRVANSGESEGAELFREERAVGFRLRDESGAVRVFPRDARFDVPDRFDEQSGAWGGSPVGLLPRTGPAFGPGPDRASQIAALLTVHDPRSVGWSDPAALGGSPLVATGLALNAGRRHYTEARIDAGDVVTVVGRALPFADLADPTAANLLEGSGVAADDPEVAADLAAARAAGTLEGTPADAWGNAAIEGFGIGRPVRAPELDPAATAMPLGDAALAQRATAAFEIAPDALVLATAEGGRLLISLGAPTTIVGRQEWRFILGLLGASLAIGCAVALAWLWTNGLPA